MRKSSAEVFLPALALVAGVLLSCGKGLASFPWKSASGKSLSFSQGASFPKGEEGKFSAERAENSYILKDPVHVEKGLMVAVHLDVGVDGLSVRAALSSDRRPKKPGKSFALPRGKAVIYLNLVGKASRSLSISFAPADPQNFAVPAGSAWATITAIAFAPEFHGFDPGDGGPSRISDDLDVETSGGTAVWRLSSPAAVSAPAEGGSAASSVPVLFLGWSQRSDADIRIAGNASLRLRATSAEKSALVPFSVLGEGSSDSITLTAPASVGLRSAYAESVGADEAEAVDPGVILLLPPLRKGADFTYRAWDLLPGVFIFDFRNYAIQDSYLKRLAFFVEKRGFAGRLASDAEMAPLHGWNAHDYRADDLAAFFSSAAKTGFKLNHEEEHLRDFLLSKRVIARTGGAFKGMGGAIISISQESPAYLRRLFLTHESSHAIFFTDEGYRQLAASIWDSTSKEERWFWKLYFGWMNYDTSSSYLMENEMQAYLIQQPVAGATKYFTETLPARLLEKHPELAGELKAYFESFGGEFAKKATMLDSWLRKKYGFGAGSTIFLR
jgi:hypothetical protein